MKQKEVPEMDDVEKVISKISEESSYKRRPTQKRTWMTVPERYESILSALKNGTPIRLNIIKLPEKNQGKNWNPADEVDPELLTKVLENPEMRALLNSQAKTMK